MAVVHVEGEADEEAPADDVNWDGLEGEDALIGPSLASQSPLVPSGGALGPFSPRQGRVCPRGRPRPVSRPSCPKAGRSGARRQRILGALRTGAPRRRSR